MVETLTHIGVILAIIYCLGLAAFLPGVLRGLRRKKQIIDREALSVSIVVCARNEEEAIGKCIESLIAQDYPMDKMEVIVVDDRSTDATADIIKRYITQSPIVKILQITDTSTLYPGKVNALIQGIKNAKGEIVILTDADCRVPKKWVREYITWFDDDVGMVSSITALEPNKLFDEVHSLEMVQVLALGMAGINYGIPTSVIGNNLSIRKRTYEDVGGYENIPFSVTEDLALFQAVWKTKWKVRFKANADLTVLTDSTPNLRAWWRQKHRWVQGGKAVGLMGYIIVALGYIGIASIILVILSSNIKTIIIGIALKIIGDLLIILPTLTSIRQLRSLIFILPYQIYMTYFLCCIPILLAQKNIRWKGHIYSAQKVSH